MPFSIVVNGYPKDNAPAPHIQGSALQGMFLHLISEVDPEIARRLHDEPGYRPYTLSPLGLGERGKTFQGFRLPRKQDIRSGTPCYLRITLLDDALIAPLNQYFLMRPMPAFRLGETEFAVTEVQATSESENSWSHYVSYADLIAQAANDQRRIKLRFLTPTTFRKSDIDLPLPLPRFVFQSYLKRFQGFHGFEFLPDFVELVDRHTGISSQKDVRTDTLKTKKVLLIGFTGDVTFDISKKAPPEFIVQMNLLADYAFFCGTGKKTTVGMGQTVRIG